MLYKKKIFLLHKNGIFLYKTKILLLVQEEDLLLVREGALLLAHEDNLLLVYSSCTILVNNADFSYCTRKRACRKIGWTTETKNVGVDGRSIPDRFGIDSGSTRGRWKNLKYWDRPKVFGK